MIIKTINNDLLQDVLELFVKSFKNDKYYIKLFPNESDRGQRMKESFGDQVSYCLQNGLSYGVYEENKMIAFVLTIDYDKLHQNQEMYNAIFGLNHNDENQSVKKVLQDKLFGLSGKTIYCLSIAVDEDYRKQGIASILIDRIISQFKSFNIISDVSNKNSLNIYRSRGFVIDELGEDYYFIKREPVSEMNLYQFDSKVKIALSNANILDNFGAEYSLVKSIYIDGISIDGEYFVKSDDNLEKINVYEINYCDLLKYQRFIGVSDFEEKENIGFIYYVRNRKNKYLDVSFDDNIIRDRQKEWNIVPDVFISIPCIYSNVDLLKPKKNNIFSLEVLRNLEFRTKYESGIISDNNENYDETAIFKNRIKRVYLGELYIQMCDENTIDNINGCSLIGKPYHVDLYVSYDIYSKCAVVGIYSLSCPFVISIFFDNVVRNQIMVINNGHAENLYEYLSKVFGISKSGSPKIYSVIPQDRDCLTSGQIGSLLSGETIYSDGENFGQIIDKDIIEAVQSENGMGQYNRGCVLAYLNVVLQFDSKLIASLSNRVAEEIITQFYIELIMFEEAAINMTDIAITKFLANPSISDPVIYLQKSETINENYAKTICFWDIHVNYPTSQKSIKMLRTAFDIDKQLEKMERNKSQLQAVFDAKCEIIDRQESKRVDTSLAALAVLAIFSALIDCFDFIGVWETYFSHNAIKIVQIIFSVLIAGIGFYVFIHLFGNKLIKKIFSKRKKK